MITTETQESPPGDASGRLGRTLAAPAAARFPRQRARSGDRSEGSARLADPAPPTALEAADVVAIVDLARTGELNATIRRAGDAERRRWYAAAYAIAYPIVFQVITRKLERKRGHVTCARGVRYLGSECVDGFYDDVEALVDHLFATTTPIEDLEAWLACCAPRAAVDGHRRRRGQRGALQRPRMTKALAAGLGNDPWLKDLALQILTWVGVPATAGADLWPLDEWAQRRIAVTGDVRGSTTWVVATEVERVLAIMRQRPRWHAEHVDRPLGLKPAPVAAPPGDGVADARPFVATGSEDVDDAHIVGLAGIALEAIAAGLQADRDPAETVITVLTTLFLGGSGAEEIGRAPGTWTPHDERLSALLADPSTLTGVVNRVLSIVRQM